MIRLLNLLHRIRRLRGDTTTEAPSESQDDTKQIARVVIERLSEDETLRGDLTDTGFAPVLSFVASLVPAAALRALVESTRDEAEEQVSHAARMLTRAIVADAENGEIAAVQQALTPPLLSQTAIEHADRAFSVDEIPGESADSRALWIVSALGAALKEPGT